MGRIVAALTVSLALAGCGGGIGSSALNPFNWFSQSEPVEVDGLVPVAALERRDPRPAVSEITDVVVERVPGGAILRARALAASGGWHTADLVLEPARSGGGTLAYSFRAFRPAVPGPSNTAVSRILVAGTFLSDQDLRGVRQLQVIGQNNARAVRR